MLLPNTFYSITTHFILYNIITITVYQTHPNNYYYLCNNYKSTTSGWLACPALLRRVSSSSNLLVIWGIVLHIYILSTSLSKMTPIIPQNKLSQKWRVVTCNKSKKTRLRLIAIYNVLEVSDNVGIISLTHTHQKIIIIIK